MARIAEEGGIPLIVSAMDKHQESTFIQRTGCGALWNLSVNGLISTVAISRIIETLFLAENNRMLIAKEGGITAIIRAMTTHKQTPRIQKNACGALWNLAINGTFLHKVR